MAETARALESVTEVPGVPPTPRVAVVGVGYWGKNLVRSLRDLGALAAVCDRDPAVLHAVAERHPGTRITGSLDDLLRDQAVDALAIATPAATHGELARLALLAGKDVLVEKPL